MAQKDKDDSADAQRVARDAAKPIAPRSGKQRPAVPSRPGAAASPSPPPPPVASDDVSSSLANVIDDSDMAVAFVPTTTSGPRVSGSATGSSRSLNLRRTLIPILL